MSYDEKLAAKRAERRVALEAKWEAELDGPLDEFIDGEHVLVQVETVGDLPGHVVCRLPTPAEASRYRSILYRDASQRGQTEARAKAGPELAAACLVWPDKEKYKAITEKYAFVPDMVAARLLGAARAKVEAEEKD